MSDQHIAICLINTNGGLHPEEIVRHYQFPQSHFTPEQIEELEGLGWKSEYPKFLNFLMSDEEDQWAMEVGDMSPYKFSKMYYVYHGEGYNSPKP